MQAQEIIRWTMNANQKMMTEGAPWKHTLRFALPVLAGSLLQQLYNTVDTIIVGNYAGEAALSAVGTTASFTFLFLAVAMGFSTGNSIVVDVLMAIFKQVDEINELIWNGYVPINGKRKKTK